MPLGTPISPRAVVGGNNVPQLSRSPRPRGTEWTNAVKSSSVVPHTIEIESQGKELMYDEDRKGCAWLPASMTAAPAEPPSRGQDNVVCGVQRTATL